MPIRRPRTERHSASSNPVISAPSKRIDPPVTAPLAGSRPIIARARVDLPEPLSPTRPTTLPRSMSKLTPSAALMIRPARR